ncbi:MAG TPA: rod shape-determining protein MreD [Actinomycetota bacterium]|nr:rod shape-determining protein MreD [Actinomycetota bacterium]
MRRAVSWGAVIVTVLLLQSTVFAQIKLFGAKPELTYLITVVLAMLEGPASGAIAGFAAGMAQDFLLNEPKGITALTLTLLGYAVGQIRQFVVTPSPLLPVALVGGATAIGVLFNRLVAFLLGQLDVGFLFVLRTALLSAIYNAILTPLLYPVLRRVAESSRAKRVFRW